MYACFYKRLGIRTDTYQDCQEYFNNSLYLLQNCRNWKIWSLHCHTIQCGGKIRAQSIWRHFQMIYYNASSSWALKHLSTKLRILSYLLLKISTRRAKNMRSMRFSFPCRRHPRRSRGLSRCWLVSRADKLSSRDHRKCVEYAGNLRKALLSWFSKFPTSLTDEHDLTNHSAPKSHFLNVWTFKNYFCIFCNTVFTLFFLTTKPRSGLFLSKR